MLPAFSSTLKDNQRANPLSCIPKVIPCLSSPKVCAHHTCVDTNTNQQWYASKLSSHAMKPGCRCCIDNISNHQNLLQLMYCQRKQTPGFKLTVEPMLGCVS